MRILIYGAGVIGCLYAILFSEAGYNTTIYARSRRLDSLEKDGLRYVRKNKIYKADVKIISELKERDCYDFIFLTVRENQLHTALRELRSNVSPNIVTMVNSLERYEAWENICGKGRIIPAFPGAGGSFEENVLNAELTPWLIQPTTFGEVDGIRTKRIETMKRIFKQSKIPCQIVKDMHTWQLCHLAMVVPIADAYYETDIPEKVWKDREIMWKTARRLRRNFSFVHKCGIVLSPKKMNLFRLIPISVLSIGLCAVFHSNFGNVFMYQHSMKAPDEMRQLHRQFYAWVSHNCVTLEFID